MLLQARPQMNWQDIIAAMSRPHAPVMRARTAVALAAAIAVACARGTSQAPPDSMCEPFHEALAGIPNVALSVRTGSFRSVWDDAEHEGCEIRFETTDSLSAGRTVPDFQPVEGSDLYAAGWRQTEGMLADGPGSSIYGIERDTVACVIHWDQPAGIDDDGEFFQSDTLDIIVQCTNRSNGV
jgi:hypothetical protein